MTYIYKIKNLSVDSTGSPVIPGSRKVSGQADGFFIAYGPFVNRRSTAMAVIYRDPSGNHLVGAEPEVLDKIPGNDGLESFAKKNPSNWHTWKCDIIRPDGRKIKGQVVKTSRMALDTNTNKPVIEADGSSIVGGSPSVPSGLGGFVVMDVDKETKWIGDKVDKDVQEVV